MPEQFIPFDHTYVLYDPNDGLSLVCVFFSLFPILVLVGYFAWFVVTREVEAVVIAGGHIVNEILNKVCKELIRHERPEFSGGSGYGMPSAHAQFMGFLSAYFFLKVILQWNVQHNHDSSRREKTIYVFCIISFAFFVCLSRVYLLYHTVIQVLVGVSLGLLHGSLYFLLVSLLRDMGFVKWVLGWKVFQLLLVRDDWHDGNTCLQCKRKAWESQNSKKEKDS